MRPVEHRLGGRVHRPLPPNVVIRRATIHDCVDLAKRLRACDRDELIASTGVTPDLALPVSLGWGPSVIELDGRAEAIFGCSRSDAITGVPWFLSTPTPLTPKWRVAFLRHSRDMVHDWQSQYPLLHNFTDARNTVHHRWLRWLGFTFTARHDLFGPLGLPFYEFVRIAPCVAPT